MFPLTANYAYLRFWIGTSPQDTVNADAVVNLQPCYAPISSQGVTIQCFVQIEGLRGPRNADRPKLDAHDVAKAIRQFIDCSGLLGPGQPLQRLEVVSVYFPKPRKITPPPTLVGDESFAFNLLDGPDGFGTGPRETAFDLGSTFHFV